MRLDRVAQELICKVVYCGPGMSGKTTNLQYIHERAPKHAVGNMVSIDTESERTLHFDLLPLDLGTVQGYKCRFEFFTVPGQSYYAATRRMVLEGSDGIVFVADSRRECLDENVDSLNDLFENIRYHKLPDDIPVIIQYNKQDLPDALSAEQLNPLLNPRNVPYYSAVAVQGDGVLESMKAITSLVIDRVSALEDVATAAKQPAFNPGAGQPAPAPRPPAPAPRTPAPQPPRPSAPAEPESWILTCYNCDTMLEVPHAAKGDMYSCGSCGAHLMVQDPDHGITTAPQTTISRANKDHQPRPQPRQKSSPAIDDYGMSAAPQQDDGAALGLADLTPSGANPALADLSFELPGYTAVAKLDESPLGQRWRISESASGRNLRALVLSHSLTGQAAYPAQLQDTIKRAQSVSSPNILKIAGARTHHHNTYVISADAPDYEPLQHVLARRGGLQLAQALSICEQLIAALSAAAAAGLHHGWLRPEAVLVRSDGAVLIDDFGVPKVHNHLLRESLGASAGTEHYLAPEHLDGTSNDARADMFQLGAVLFRMVTGAGLVTGYSAHEALHKVRASGARALRSLNPEVSRELDDFCKRLTAANPNDRYRDFNELQAAWAAVGGRRQRGMNLTRSVPAPASSDATPGRRSVGGRVGTGAHRRTGTAAHRRPAGGGTAAHRPTAAGSGGHARPRQTPMGGTRQPPRVTTHGAHPHGHGHGHAHAHPPSRKQGGGGIVAVIILLVLIAIGAGAAFVYFNQDKIFPQPVTNDDPQPVDNNTAPTNPSTPKPPVTPSTQPDQPDQPQTPVLSEATRLRNAADSATAAYLASPHDEQLLAQARAAIAALRPEDPTYAAQLHAQVRDAVPVGDGPATTDPQPNPPDTPTTPAELTPERQAEIEQAIADARFGAAMQLIRDNVSNPTQREGWLSEVSKRHEDARAGVQRQVMQATSVEAAQAAIDPALATWQMEGDEEWAAALLKITSARFSDGPVESSTSAPGTQAGTQAGTQSSGLTPSGLSLLAVKVNSQVDAALATGNFKEAESRLGQLSEGPERSAIARKIELWTNRASVLQQQIATKAPKLSLTPPIGDQAWDVVGCNETIVNLSLKTGGAMELNWHNVKRHELGRLFVRAAGETATPVEFATAAVASFIAGDLGEGGLAARRAREGGYAHADDLQNLLALAREAELVQTIARADAALAANNTAGLTAAIEELQESNRADEPGVAAEITRLLDARAKLNAGATTSTNPAAKDLITFDAIEDRDSFTRSGTWTLGGGTYTNSGNASLSREDCGNARSVTITFLTPQQAGAFAVSFRGTRFIADFASQSILVDSGEKRLPPQPFPLLANTNHQLHLRIDANGDTVIEINQADPLRIKPGRLSSELILRADTGAVVSLEEIEIKRGEPKAAPSADANQQVLRDALGLEPIGKAYKDPDSPAIVLPKVAMGVSGIGIPVTESTAGVDFSVRGTDQLVVGLGSVRKGVADGALHTVPLPDQALPPLKVEVRWTSTNYEIIIRQEGLGPTLVEGQLPVGWTHVIIQATDEARLDASPKIQRR